MTHLPALIVRNAPRELVRDASPIVRIQKMIFAEAATLGASDIHIEPGRAFTRVRYRVDGFLQQTMELPRWMHDGLTVRIKVMANLDVTEKRLPLDGHIDADSPAGD